LQPAVEIPGPREIHGELEDPVGRPETRDSAGNRKRGRIADYVWVRLHEVPWVHSRPIPDSQSARPTVAAALSHTCQ
ncbi:hypothetical protein T12_13355, partial [Trichinella patagoniensis]